MSEATLMWTSVKTHLVDLKLLRYCAMIPACYANSAIFLHAQVELCRCVQNSEIVSLKSSILWANLKDWGGILLISRLMQIARKFLCKLQIIDFNREIPNLRGCCAVSHHYHVCSNPLRLAAVWDAGLFCDPAVSLDIITGWHWWFATNFCWL